jgi:hypothetical protein
MTKTKILIILLAFLIPFYINESFCQQNQFNNHKEIVYQMHHLRGLSDDVVIATLDTADNLVQNGDTLILSELINLSFKSDGYVSEYIGTILGDLILNKTEFFLNALINKTEEDQKRIATFSFYTDGSGMPLTDYDKIEAKLKKIKLNNHNKLSKVAEICLTALKEVEKFQN